MSIFFFCIDRAHDASLVWFSINTCLFGSFFLTKIILTVICVTVHHDSKLEKLLICVSRLC